MKRADSTPDLTKDEELLQTLGRIVAEGEVAPELPLSAQPGFEQRVMALLEAQHVDTLGEQIAPAPVSQAIRDLRSNIGGDIGAEIANDTQSGATSAAAGFVEENGASPPTALTPKQASARPWAKAGAWGLPVATAAALLLWFAAPASDVEPLGVYELTVRAAVSSRRSASGAANGEQLLIAPPYSPEFVFQPEEAVAGKLETRAWINVNGDIRQWRHETQIATSGAVKLVLRNTETLPATGELILVLGREGVSEVSEPPRAVAAGEGWQQFRRSYRIAASN